jgi:hypothetical protein
MKRIGFLAVMATVAALGLVVVPVSAQLKPTPQNLRAILAAKAAPETPCCGITAIDTKTGQVTARVTATGQTFSFTASPSVLNSLKVGQGVYANFTSKQVSVDGLQPCCGITAMSEEKQAARPPAAGPAPGIPCCAITAIDTKTGQVTARVTASGQTFSFTASPSMLNSLKVGQGVFANFTSKQVSVDGVAPCCTIVAAPAGTTSGKASGNRMSQAPATNDVARPETAASQIAEGISNPCAGQNQPTSAKTGNVPQPLKTATGGPSTFGDSICAGTPYKRTVAIAKTTSRFDARQVTATVNQQTVKGTILHLRGLDGIQQALAQGLIPKTVGDILSMHVRALAAGESDHYLVNPDLALAWSKTHPEPPLAAGKATDNHEGCDKWSMHCAGEVVQHAESQVEQLRQQAVQDWQHMAAQAAQLYKEQAACFNESSKTLAKIPIEFDEPFQVNYPFADSGKSGSFSGSVNGKVGLGLPVQMDVTTDVSVFYVECLPFMIRPRGVDGAGSVTVGTNFIAQITATGTFKQDFPIFSTTPPYPIQVIPIVVAGVPLAEVDMSAYVAADVNVEVTATASASYQAQHNHTINLQFSCSGAGCTGHTTQGPTVTKTSESAEIKGQATITPAVYTALQFDFDFDALSLRAGPKPALIAQINGCDYSAEQTVSGKPAAFQHSDCLVADLDWKIDFVSQALIGGKSVASSTDANFLPRRHIYFDDLLSSKGASTALIAGVSEVPNSGAGKPVFFKVQMPRCYPYTDKVQYKVAWNGGGSGVPDPAACTWNNSAGTGICFADPTKELEIGFQWPAGNHSLSVTLVHDQHPREFTVQLNPVSVEVPSGVTASNTNK